MGKKLAIKGHITRGKEVIVLLELLGGKNVEGFIGTASDELYTIEDGCIIQAYDWNHCVCFTLEEFLAKYPFKVGDKVIDVADGCPGIIDKINWDEDVCDMKYYVIFGHGIDFGWYTNDTIKFYQPENSKDVVTTVNETQPKRDIYASEFMITHMMLPETPHNVNDELEYKIIDGYEFDRVENNKIILKVVKPKYPMTFEECLNMLYCKSVLRTIIGHKAELLLNLEKLLICRKAYWKIAGEEIGLDKPWKPDFTNDDEERYGIYTVANKVVKDFCGVGDVNTILTFPTEEMRDAFYKNFKDLIESCKELL